MSDAWPRPVPTIGDVTSAAERAADPRGWAFPREDRLALARVVQARRDIRRFRPDPIPPDVLDRILHAAHAAPSVGHSQPWRFVVVSEPAVRASASVLADQARLAQAAVMEEAAGRHLLDLDLEGIREAPLGIVVCCDRRVPADGVLGRATFQDADLWSCACAIQNLWLSARVEGLGVGWVTLFQPGDLADLVGAPEGVETLGWLCVGWPDERPPDPGLERRGWSERIPLDGLVMHDRWGPVAGRDDQEKRPPPPPRSRLAIPSQRQVVAAHDTADSILSAPASLGVLDRIVDKVIALGRHDACVAGGVLVLAAADHPVHARRVSPYGQEVTREVVEASIAGVSLGAVAAHASGLEVVVVDAGIEGDPVEGSLDRRPAGLRGDLVATDAMTPADTAALFEAGALLGKSSAGSGTGVVALGEVGVGNTTVAAALSAALLGLDPDAVVGLGAGADSAMVAAKRAVVAEAVRRVEGPEADPFSMLGALGGPEIAFLAGVVDGVARAGGVVILDGLATSVAALVPVLLDPAVAAHLIAGQRSREAAHARVLQALGLEPLLDLRLRAGEGVGACLAAGIVKAALRIRRDAARTC